MAEVKKIATRDSYGNTLKELAAEGHDELVVLDADLAAATKTGMFRKAYPGRHFDCGIAEGNMMGVAAGLSTMGYVPLFPALPCLPRAARLSRSATPSATLTSTSRSVPPMAASRWARTGASTSAVRILPHAQHPRDDGHLPR